MARTLVQAYNINHSNVTGLSPFYVMYSRQPMLPIYVQFGVRTPDIVPSTSHSYIQKLQKRLDWAYKSAQDISKKESECSKRRYNQNVKWTKLELDLVLVRQKAFKGKCKISDRGETTPYQVIQHVGEHLPVYSVQLMGENTKTRTLYRNLLFPLTLKNESDKIQQNLEEKEPKLISSEDETIDDDNYTSTNKHISMKDQSLGVELRE